ncbi:Uncharacterized protein HZ326_27255 [Fusarium oxysporum f. sp. albedinis]|nr:Uncharacterized protein HZ326_27255 [Fusarium oxysporum f. sp. albedinis]
MALEPAQQKAAAEVVKAAQNSSIVKDHVDDVKVQKWKDNDWTRMLGAAPLCLELLGSCCLVSSTQVAQTTKLTPPTEGFKYLKGYTYLSANLVEVANRGSRAFMTANKNMSRIKENSSNVKSNVVRVLNALRQPKFDQMTVEIELGTLKDVANQCVKHSKEMDDEFTTWLYFIMELHESCQNEEGRGTELFQDIVSQEKAQTVYQEEQNKMLAEHKKKVEEMEKKVKEAHELYQKLHDEFPTG